MFLKFSLSVLFLFDDELRQTEIEGRIIDPDYNLVEVVHVILLNKKDSTYINYSLTDKQGYFKITEKKQGKVIL